MYIFDSKAIKNLNTHQLIELPKEKAAKVGLYPKHNNPSHGIYWRGNKSNKFEDKKYYLNYGFI